MSGGRHRRGGWCGIIALGIVGAIIAPFALIGGAIFAIVSG